MESSEIKLLEFKIAVQTKNVATSIMLADDLERIIKCEAYDASISRHKNSNETMDHGTIISVVAASGAVVAVGRGIQAWLSKHHSASIDIDGDHIRAQNLTAKDAVRLAEIFKAKKDF